MNSMYSLVPVDLLMLLNKQYREYIILYLGPSWLETTESYLFQSTKNKSHKYTYKEKSFKNQYIILLSLSWAFVTAVPSSSLVPIYN